MICRISDTGILGHAFADACGKQQLLYSSCDNANTEILDRIAEIVLDPSNSDVPVTRTRLIDRS